MRKYTNEIAYIPQGKKDEFVLRSRQQAFNIGVSRFIIALIITACIQYSTWYFFQTVIAHVLIVLSIAYGLYEYGSSLREFTYEDREFLVSQYGLNQQQEIIIDNNKPEIKNESTLLPMASGTGSHLVHVGLTISQLEQIATCALDKGNLTINYLQSIGLSRQESELFRIELANCNIVQFDKHEKAIVTKYGKKVFSKVLR